VTLDREERILEIRRNLHEQEYHREELLGMVAGQMYRIEELEDRCEELEFELHAADQVERYLLSDSSGRKQV
jgi:predicted RNase H-like nuclease (RuvC/YqgF family)